jgi:glycosyltransferase involved in cell wall biosynthesis
MKRVLFLYQSERLPSSRIRVQNLLPEIRKAGIEAAAMAYPRTPWDKVSMLTSLRKYDVVYLQKKLLSPFEARWLRLSARRLIYDFDDAIYGRDDHAPTFECKTREARFRRIVRSADRVAAGNRVLAEHAGPYNRDVAIIPSAVETRGIPVHVYRREVKPFVIGWAGGKGNLHHLTLLESVLQRLSKEFDIQLKVLCDDSLAMSGVSVCHEPWSLANQEAVIATFDAGVMPLPRNPWTEGKCGYKALQYMAAAVPAVCSDVGSNRDLIRHGEEGFVLGSIEEFYPSLRTLIEDPELRREMGARARKRVEAEFSIEVVGRRVADLILDREY